MAKGGKKEANGGKAKSDPEAEERKRLKRLAVSKGMISDTPAKPSASLSLSKLVVKHHGKDIIKKSQRKNKYLFSFPGLLAPVAGGKIGELKDLGTKNPILYLDFPQGRMKLFGTIMYPKNRYLTLQFSRGGKNVMCEDSFDTMIVFSDAWWIGKKEENPEEARLDFPKELAGEQPVECDFRGGAGSTTQIKSGMNQHVPKFVKEQTPMKDLEDDSFKSENDVTEILEQTPTRHSARTSNKSYKFAEASSSDTSSASDDDISLIAEKKNEAKNSNMHESNADTKEPLTQSKKVSRSSSQVADGVPCNKRGSLIQSTISTLFKKAEKKGEPRSSRKSTPLPAVEQKSQRTKSSRKINVDDDETDGTRKKRKLVKGTNLKTVETQLEREMQDENDAIEEFSSSSQETDGSDQDWSGDI